MISKEERCKLASSIRDKILSEDKICNKISDKENTYQLSPEIMKEYKELPNSDLNELSANQSHVASLPRQPDKKSSTTKPRVNEPKADESLATSVPVPASAPKQPGAKKKVWGLF
ncbi:hypothetical protein [Wolbachia endosymbiont (group E) of Neria commutata]|uniref:hypothetical protein n=1 Tax=Wolbachia endosymbiont (group E) of Neria commutata TaxID=3066149 RepID=UPI0031332A74